MGRVGNRSLRESTPELSSHLPINRYGSSRDRYLTVCDRILLIEAGSGTAMIDPSPCLQTQKPSSGLSAAELRQSEPFHDQ
jgi:hypothetical protein